jgi:hypothetical protein
MNAVEVFLFLVRMYKWNTQAPLTLEAESRLNIVS